MTCSVCSTDRRSKSLGLTYEGKLLFEEVQVVHDKVLGNMFSAMRKNKKRDIKSDLTFILRHFSPEKIE